MNSKKIGVILLILSIILLIIFISTFRQIESQGTELGCFDNQDCLQIQSSFSMINIGFGLFGFILALAFYLLVFAKNEDLFLKKLDQKQAVLDKEEKLKYLFMGLDQFEKEVVAKVREQPGITQSTLRIRVDMSKAKLSQVLSNLEKKNLIKRKQQKKTLAVYFIPTF
tara:strand:- start:24037 stop:24540 length:504 start_codon:yes stop_codon:yes gene_type:complete